MTVLKALLSQQSKPLLYVLGLTFVAEMLAIAPILFFMSLAQRAVPTHSYATLVSLVVLMLGVYLFWGAIEWVRSRILVRLALRLDWELSPDVFDATFKAHLRKQNVNVLQLMTDLTELRNFITGPIMVAVMSIPFAIIFVIFAALIHPFLGLFMLVGMLTLGFSAYLNQRVTTPILQEANNSAQEATRKAAMFLKSAETTSALGMLPAARKHWYGTHVQSLSMNINAREATGLTGGFSGYFNRLMPDLAKALIGILAIASIVDPNLIWIGAMLFQKTVMPINTLLANWNGLVKVRQAHDRLNALLGEHLAQPERMPLPAPKGELKVEGLIGGPPGAEKPVIHGLNFGLKAGEALAIVGVSASGKSSLMKLLLGLWKPTDGSVRLDGVEISDWDHVELGPHLGYVPQEVVFFEGTIAENIARLGEVASEKVVAAAQLVGLHEVILSFPNGYDTPLSEVASFGLSGGQRQRLAIARALYGQPKFVVMDEPNANLDELGEAALVQTVQRLKQLGCTVVMTTHRPRLISCADTVLILKKGQMVMYGPTQEVIAKIRAMTPGLTPAEKDEIVRQLPEVSGSQSATQASHNGAEAA